jgi:molecular chaperone DnaJ
MKKNEAYETLGLTQTATEEDIKKAFRKLAVQYHPDKNKDNPKAEETFKKINQAYQILTGKEKAEDDMPNFSSGGSNPFDFMDNFMDFFGNPFANPFSNQKKPQSNDMFAPVFVKTSVNFEESILGCKKHISYKIKHYCEKCCGDGIDTSSKKRCDKCRGTGWISKSVKNGNYINTTRTVCENCRGKGEYGNPCKE